MATLPVINAQRGASDLTPPPEGTRIKRVSPRKRKEFDYIDFVEVEPLLNLLKNEAGMTEPSIVRALGYSSTALSQMRGRGRVMRHFKFTLEGLLASKLETVKNALASARPPANGVMFTEDETTRLIRLCQQARKSTVQQSAKDEIASIQTKLAKHLVSTLTSEN